MATEIDGIPIKQGTKNTIDLDALELKLKQLKEEQKAQQEQEEKEKLEALKPVTFAPAEDEEVDDDYEIEDEEEIKQTKKEKQNQVGTNYGDIIEDMPDLKQDLDYLLIINKIKKGEKVSKKDLEYKQIYEEAKAKEQAFQEASQRQFEEEQAKQSQLQEQINKEYDEIKSKYPEKIEIHDSKTLGLRGSDNFLKVALTWLQLAKSHKKGGKIFIKVARAKKVSIEWTTKDLRFVEFWSTNERGDKVKEITRISEFKYTFDGTSIPVLFAIQGISESYDFYDLMRRDLTSETVSGIAMEAYNSGYKDGLVLADGKPKSGLLSFLTEFMPLILIVGFLVMGWLLWQMYDSTQASTEAIRMIQQQLAPQTINDLNNVMVVR
jgi:chemotaxis protein histidine kinase CheA